MNQPLLTPPNHDQPLLLPPPKKSYAGALTIVIVIAVVIAATGIFFRIRDAHALRTHTRENAIPDVTVIQAPPAPATDEITLPGSVQAWHEAPIYARTNGYLKDWKTDIGAKVHEGDLLAEIETPEVESQLHQAQADLATAKANNELAQSTARRWVALLKTKSVSQQDADVRVSDAAAKEAAVLSAQANVERLTELVGFTKVVAPFDGTITARNTDTGALINSGSNGTAPELFHISDMHKLRIYIQVPENYVPNINDNMDADLYFPEHPGQVFKAKFGESADAIDPVARTLLVQLNVDNEDGALLPGGYTEVHIHVPADKNAVRLPVNTLLFRAQGLQVGTVGPDNKVVLKDVKISRDFGSTVEILSGITPHENIIINPPDSLANGQKVNVISQNEASAKAKADNDKGQDKKSKSSAKAPAEKTEGEKSAIGKGNGKDSGTDSSVTGSTGDSSDSSSGSNGASGGDTSGGKNNSGGDAGKSNDAK